MSASGAQTKKRFRGVILKIVYQNQEKQKSRLDDVTLTGVLERLNFDVYVDLVRMLLQDLAERGMVSFREDRSRKTGEVAIRQIQILPKGRDVIERTVEDPAIDAE